MYSKSIFLSTLLSTALAGPIQLWPPHGAALSGRDVSIDFSPWMLQLPAGSPGHPDTISTEKLQSGFANSDYFYTDGDTLVMKVPGGPDSGCVTTPNSQHCRTELRESAPGSWDPNTATNALRATLTVTQADSSSHGTVVGQIHIADDDTSGSTKPVCELFYSNKGHLSMGVEETVDGNLKYADVGDVPLGQQFSYEIRYEGGKLSVKLDDGEAQELDTYQLDSPKSYFKAGNYNQAKGGEDPSEVRFTSIEVEHSS